MPSIANIKKRQFVCYAGHTDFLEWNGSALNPVVLNGLDPTKIRGLVAANTYLIAYDLKTIYWSSTVDPTDFIPSLQTGAGSSDVLALKGEIVCCTPIADGFLIYTTGNVVAAFYSGNIRFPWTFKEITGGPGVDSFEKVVFGTNSYIQYVWALTGLVEIDRNNAKPAFPEVSEFLACRRLEYFDYQKKEIVQVDLSDSPLVKVALVAQRWLVLSYGDTELKFALVYDSALRRWGKLAITHVDCFEYIGRPATETTDSSAARYNQVVGSYQVQTSTYAEFGGLTVVTPAGANQVPYKSLGFLKKTGEVQVVNFDLSGKADSVIYLGKFQLVRARFLSLHDIWAEECEDDTDLDILSTLDGRNFLPPAVPFFDEDGSDKTLKHWLCSLDGMNHTLRFQGTFKLASYEMSFSVGGYR
jgi:hypothetical protein